MDAASPLSVYVAVGFWTSNRVEILTISNAESYLQPGCEGVNLTSLPRSIIFHNFGSTGKSSSDYLPHLLVGLGDGSLVSYTFRNSKLKDRRVFSFGSSPASLVRCDVDGERTILAFGSRAGVLFWNKGRLQHSPVLVKVNARLLIPLFCTVGLFP